jgi:uncharacterized membrane protein YjjP (DUF1212 family)
MLVSFGDGEQGSSEMTLVKSTTFLDLGRLTDTHRIYKKLTHAEIGAREAADELEKLIDENREPIYSKPWRCIFGFWTAFLVCPMAFGGSFIDACVAGTLGCIVTGLSLYGAQKSAVFSTVYE